MAKGEVGMSSIRRRLLCNFVIIVVLTVATLNTIIFFSFRNIYYSNIANLLIGQIKISSDIYTKYFSKNSLYENVLNGVDVFLNRSDIEVQVFDNTGRIIFDSIGVIEENEFLDIKEALSGNIGRWIGNVSYDDEKVMAVSHPLYSGGEIIGGIRFITTLREVNKDLRSIFMILTLLGLIVTLIFAFVSILFSNQIVVPIVNITEVAKRMAEGDYNKRCRDAKFDEIKNLSTTLNYMADEIIKREKLKDEFISSVSHELRTPLTSIKGWAITLKDLEGDKELLKDGLDIIEKECDRLTSMVEELLDFSKLSSGKIEFKFKSVDINTFLDGIRKQIEPRAYRENKIFSILKENKSIIIEADENRLKQVFINLLDNAFNFTNAGDSIVIKVKENDEDIVIVVEDTGLGISKEDLPHVFEKFYKGRGSRSKNGIGLSICKDIVEKMKGSIKIESEENKGTRVYVTFPKGGVIR
ncbi:HAMP domain-containing sensor histidine kinase [Caloramator proteoclasticus]|uniref:histidine kinase n=1 Tax=Caloramator proteoclasticus DSM 10124 TaxID=1121262 RepID=A0A1M4ZKG0_9CLOT|nr:HAMP domain-containing sensor histidine kinase [Caloramator proteoclasticus]SHF18458.1 Signal transduction histidine kinase [Caloramator proteoclasticus DSM 10124]